MTPRDIDPAVWAAAYAAEYRGQREAARLARADTLTRHAPAIGVDVERCRELADAAVLALHPEGVEPIGKRLARATVHPEAPPPLPEPDNRTRGEWRR